MGTEKKFYVSNTFFLASTGVPIAKFTLLKGDELVFIFDYFGNVAGHNYFIVPFHHPQTEKVVEVQLSEISRL